MLADPILHNSQFGLYTNFVNLLGLAAIAVPAGFGPSGLPAGVTLIGPGFRDDALTPFAGAMHAAAACGMGRDRHAAVPPSTIARNSRRLAAHRRRRRSSDGDAAEPRTDPPRRHQTDRDDHRARLPPLRTARNRAANGMIADPAFAGTGIAVEVWALPAAAFGAFVARIPAPWASES